MLIPITMILFSIAIIAGTAHGQSENVIKVPKGETEINIVLEMEVCEPVAVKVEQCITPTPSPRPVVIQTPIPTIKATPKPPPRAWYRFW